MPLSALAEFVLLPIFELVGYVTGKVVIPLVSLGRASVEGRESPARPRRWHGFHRSEGGRVIVEAEMAAFLGIAFWFLVGATAFALTYDPRGGNSCREVSTVAPNGG